MCQQPAVSPQQLGELLPEALPFGRRKYLHASPPQWVSLLLETGKACEDRPHMLGDRVNREGVIFALDARAP